MVAAVKIPRAPTWYTRVALNGIAVETAYPAAKTPGYVWLEDETTGIRYEKTVVAGVPTWVSQGTAPIVAAKQVAYGNAAGTGITSSPQLTYDPATVQFETLDDEATPVPVLQSLGQLAKRAVVVLDETSTKIMQVAATVASRAFQVFDGAAVSIEKIDATTAGRTITDTDSAGVTMAVRNTVAATRTDEIDDSAAAVMRRTNTVAATRTEEWFDAAAASLLKFTLTTAGRQAQFSDGNGIAGVLIRLRTALRIALFEDEALHAMRSYDLLAADRTITDTDEAGAQTLLATLLSGSKAYTFGAAGAASKHKLDLVALVDQLLGANGTTVTANWDWATGRIGLQATDASGTPGNATINKPMGRAAIASGATSCAISNSTVAAADTVLCIAMTRDATGLALLPTTVGANSFTVTVAAAATGNITFAFLVIKAL